MHEFIFNIRSKIFTVELNVIWYDLGDKEKEATIVVV